MAALRPQSQKLEADMVRAGDVDAARALLARRLGKFCAWPRARPLLAHMLEQDQGYGSLVMYMLNIRTIIVTVGERTGERYDAAYLSHLRGGRDPKLLSCKK